MFKYNDVFKLLIISALILQPVAKAGNGNANSGGSNGNGGQSGAVNNGNTTGASTGGLNGGNNGNGVGNTGPGNQGNDKPVGNASTAGSQGGSNGNANSGGSNGGNPNDNTGGYNGGNNGNGVGNTGPGNQGNDKPVGNACGHNCTTGSVEGGTTGSTDGGSTNGDITTGSTSGGETTGTVEGGTTGEETTGTTSGGETSGGTSTGGETSGGETTGGETTGETNGGSTSGGTTGGVTETKPKEKFKARLLPLVFGNYDIMNKAVNLTPADEYDMRANQARLDDYQNGFLVTQLRQWDAGLGVLPNLYIQNASGLASLANVSIGLAPTKGRYVEYERLVSDEKELKSLKALPIPSSTKLLNNYKVGESVYFENNGGIVFLAGAGLSAVYAGTSVVAEGSYRTKIRKTDRGASVEVVQAKVRSASAFTGVAILKLDASRVKQLSEGFAYEFDFGRGGNVATKAYEQLLAGNMTAAQEASKNASATGVNRVADMKNREHGRKRNISVGIPMVAMYNWTAGKTYGQTATKAYADKTTTDLNYGVYFKEEKGRFFHKHKKLTRAFYSSRATTKDASEKVISVNEEANFVWSFESDAATSSSYSAALELFNKDLGLKSDFAPVVEKGQKLQFVRLEANVKIPENYMKQLISESAISREQSQMAREAMKLVDQYFAQGDELDLCRDENASSSTQACEQKFKREAMNAVKRIQKSLTSLKDKRDSASYTFAVALMGKELVKNQFVMNAFFAQDTSCSVKFDVKLEGRRLSRMTKQVPANKSCRR